MDRRTVLLTTAAALAAGGVAVAAGLRSMGSMADYEAAVAEARKPIAPPPDLAELIRYATLAANSHNTQPWRFRPGAEGVDIRPDLARRTPAVDPEDRHLFVSLGCAAANLEIAGGALGRPAEVRFEPEGGGRLVVGLGSGAPTASPLFEAIPLRQSSRSPYDGRPVGVDDLGRLADAARLPGVETVFLTEGAQRQAIHDLVIEGNTRQMGDRAFVEELKAWIRYNPAEALRRRDGLFAKSSGNPTLPGWISGPVFDLAFRVGAENDKNRRNLESSAGIAVFFADRDDPEHWTRVGRAFERFALEATALGLRHAHMNQPVEVRELRPELAALLAAGEGKPCLVIRFGYGPTLTYSLRRPVSAVID